MSSHLGTLPAGSGPLSPIQLWTLEDVLHGWGDLAIVISRMIVKATAACVGLEPGA